MPFSANHIKNDKRTVEVEYGGETGSVTYKPSEITPSVLADMREANEEGNDFFAVDVLCKLLTDWEVMDSGDPPKPLPIDEATLKGMANAFLSAILAACIEDMTPKKKSGRK